ncbi:hypothetical protein N7486_004166 [Penicillium sp. IBT 16267x]|nr:hypothetical protein N7486_004166 [Penicillium sp. IBT 16267x]
MTTWTPAYLRHLDGLPPRAINLELETTLFWAPGAAAVYPSHEDFCDFREHLLANPRGLRAMYPSLAAQVRVWLELVNTQALFLLSLRMHACNVKLRNMTSPGPPLAVPVFALAWSPNTIVPGTALGVPGPPVVPDILTGAIAAGCHECISALVDIDILPLDPAPTTFAAYNECGCSLFMVAILAYMWGRISEDQCNNVIDILTQTNGEGTQLWNRNFYTIYGLPTALPATPPISPWLILQNAVEILPTKSIEMISEWHESSYVGALDPLMFNGLYPSLLYELCGRASIRIAEWLMRHGTSLAHGYSIGEAPWPGILGKNCWHAIVRNPAGVELFDYLVSQMGTPFAAFAFPSLRCFVTDESPMWDAIEANRPEMVEKFANYHPPNAWVNHPHRCSEFLWALIKTSVESATSLHHVVGIPTFQAFCTGYCGTHELAIEDMANWVLSWYEWNYHIANVWAIFDPYRMEGFQAQLRRVATLKMTAVLHYMDRTWFGGPGEAALRARIVAVGPGVGAGPGASFLLRHIRPDIRFHVTRRSGRRDS